MSYHVSGRRWRPADALWQTQLTALVSGTAIAAMGFVCRVAAVGYGVPGGLDMADIIVGFAALPFAVSVDLVVVSRAHAAALPDRGGDPRAPGNQRPGARGRPGADDRTHRRPRRDDRALSSPRWRAWPPSAMAPAAASGAASPRAGATAPRDGVRVANTERRVAPVPQPASRSVLPQRGRRQGLPR